MPDRSEINELDRAEIARQVLKGFTSGVLDDEFGYRTSWSIEINKFNNNEPPRKYESDLPEPKSTPELNRYLNSDIINP